MHNTHIWLRAETKPYEQRTALPPQCAEKLIKAGFIVTIELSTQSIFQASSYAHLAVKIVPQGSWVDAPKDAFILGLKELPEDDFPLYHRHIYFAHAYKQQKGWQALLTRFKTGNGKLYDLEFLVDDNNRRIAAFGYWAGFAGAALAVLAWVKQNQNNEYPPLKDLSSFPNKQVLLSKLQEALISCDRKPSVFVMGAQGRSGQGASDLVNELGLPLVQWDKEETKRGGPFSEIIDQDIFVNCVLVNNKIAPFISAELINRDSRKLSVIVDVSCDPYGSYNPIPIYDQCTTFKSPCLRIDNNNVLDLIAIDHLPSLLPKESSEDFGQQLVTHLLGLVNTQNGVWPQALALFEEISKELSIESI